MPEIGKLAKWDDSRGFGFIQPASGGPHAFVHISAFKDRRRRPSVGDELCYTVARDLQNRLSAGNVRYHATERERGKNAQSGRNHGVDARQGGLVSRLFIACLAIASVSAAAWMGRLPFLLPVACVCLSLTAFLFYAFDKSAAMNRRWRTNESTLHVINLAGGWPGALIASHLFHHKTKKTSFNATFLVCIVLNCAVLTGWTFGLLPVPWS